MTANNLEAKPTTHAIASTINTINDLDPAGFIIPEDPLPTATDVVAISLVFNCIFFSNDGLAMIHRWINFDILNELESLV